MSEIHEQYFESLYESQMQFVDNTNKVVVRDARRVILDLVNITVAVPHP